MLKKMLSFLCIFTMCSFAGVIWDGSDETTGGAGRVMTGADDGTDSYGYWYSYTDADNSGTSSIVFPAGVEKDEFGNFFGPLAKTTGGVVADFSLTSAYQYPFVGFAFNIASEKTTVAADISCWGGIAVTSANSVPMIVEIGVVNEKTVTEFNNYTATVPANADRVELPWSKFTQQTGWGKTISQSLALSTANSIKFKFGGAETDAGLNGSVKITKLETLTDCSPAVSGAQTPSTPTITPTDTPSNIPNYYDNTALIIDSNISNFKFIKNVIVMNKIHNIDVFDINGQLVKSTTALTLDLSKLSPGIYFVKANSIHKVHVK